LLLASGCAKKNVSSSPTPSGGVQPSGSPQASQAPAGGTGGTTATASPGATTPAATNAPGGKDNTPPPTITKAQLDKLGPTSTYDDLLKLTGNKPGKLVKDENGKKTYEYQIANEKNYYADLTYFQDGHLSEKNIFQRQ
jgi:hypothetical protein